MEEQVERLDAVAATDRVDVAKARGGQQRRLRALALEHRVDGDGRAVQDFGELARLAIRERRLSATPAVGSAGTVDVFEVTTSPSMSRPDR